MEGDLSNSPAYHTRSLSIRGIPTITATDAGVGSWTRTFHSLVNFSLDTLLYYDDQVSLVLSRGLSPTLKSLHLAYNFIPYSKIFSFVCSFPLLKNLALVSYDHISRVDGWRAPLTSPKLAGSLYLGMKGGCGLSRANCWASRVVSTSPESQSCVSTKTLILRRICCLGVLTP